MPTEKMSLPEHGRRGGRDAQIEQRWGRLAMLISLMGNEPPSITACRTGAAGHGVLAAHLDDALDDSVIVLHGRRVPHGPATIDHVVVAPSGIWLVGAEVSAGRVERRSVGTRRHPDARLFVGGRDSTQLVHDAARQVRAVRGAIEPLGLAIAPIHPALVFVGSDWGLFAKSFEIDGVLVTRTKRLVQAIGHEGPWTDEVMRAVARQLAAALPPAG
jgi:hypothetical protein